MESISFNDTLELPTQSDVQIAPDGRRLIFTQREVNWDENRYDRNVWLAEGPKDLRRLTYGPADAHTPRWSPDGRHISYLSKRGQDKGDELYLSDLQGEARRLTSHECDIRLPAWSPDGRKIAFLASDPLDDAEKERERNYGDLHVENEDYRYSHLWVVHVADSHTERLTSGKHWTVNSFKWSPEGERIAFDSQPAPDLEHIGEAQIRVVELATLRVTVVGGKNRRLAGWSLDGTSLLATYSCEPAFLMNNQLAWVSVASGQETVLPVATDEDIWTRSICDEGIFAIVPRGSGTEFWLIDPVSGKHRVISPTSPHGFCATDATITPDGQKIGCIASSAATLPELILIDTHSHTAKPWSSFSDRVADWSLSVPEDYRWQSLDGTEIEGVLYRPVDSDPAEDYPLFVIIHGGPSWFSARELLPTAFQNRYPGLQWLARGAYVLMPNYRGSIGRGQPFKALNARNLGLGDYADVISGVDALLASENIDPERIGAMGWSQGGYISAFITTYSDRFKAVSVGAGISNWLTYYVNTDIHEFTRQYLDATPWDDPEIYARTSPMTYIKNARTPTLIQHGEFDTRVPTPNAYELYQGLRDQNVPTRLVIYKEMGHGITKPRLQKHTLQDNYDWFETYLWAETPVKAERSGTLYLALPEDAARVRRWANRDQADFRIVTWAGLLEDVPASDTGLPNAEEAAALLNLMAATFAERRWAKIVFHADKADEKVRTLVNCVTQAASVLGGGLYSAAN